MTHDELEAKVVKLEALMSELLRQPRRRSKPYQPTPDDLSLVTAIIGASRVGQAFTSADLFSAAKTIPGPLQDAVRACGFRNACALGRRLSALAGINFDRVYLTSRSSDARGQIWELRDKDGGLSPHHH